MTPSRPARALSNWRDSEAFFDDEGGGAALLEPAGVRALEERLIVPLSKLVRIVNSQLAWASLRKVRSR
jgi:hypothetical protein